MSDVRQPALAAADAVAASVSLFNEDVDGATSLGSERDQAWLLTKHSVPTAVLKVSHAAEDAAALDMECAAVAHALTVDASIPLVLPKLARDGLRRALWTQGEERHWARCYAFVDGVVLDVVDGPISDALLVEWGKLSARLSRSLRSFSHASSHRPPSFAWDLRHAETALRPLVGSMSDPQLKSLCLATLAGATARLACVLPTLRHQFTHADLHPGNVLVDAATRGAVVGVVDFGDCQHCSLVSDVAASLSNLANGAVAAFASSESEGDSTAEGDAPSPLLLELRHAARLFLDGYTSVTPLEQGELEALPDAWMARCVAEISIASHRISAGLEPADRSGPGVSLFASQLRALASLDGAQRRAFAAAPGPLPPPSLRDAPAKGGGGPDERGDGDALARLLARREAAIGPGSEPLSYAAVCGVVQPLSGDGPWIHVAQTPPPPAHPPRAPSEEAAAAQTESAMTPLAVAPPPMATAAGAAAQSGANDAQQWRLLDAYNNVACVGHCHPRVASAVACALRTSVNANLRYLHAPSISLAERLLASCNDRWGAQGADGVGDGGSGGGGGGGGDDDARLLRAPPLDTVFFVNSGSEANDLAWRVACAHRAAEREKKSGSVGGSGSGSGGGDSLAQPPLRCGGLCTEWAYHGITAATIAFSPETAAAGRAPPPAHVERWAVLSRNDDESRGDNDDAFASSLASFDAAVARLQRGGHSLAATLLDGVLTSDGVADLPGHYVRSVVARTRAAGGLYVADEVQAGHGRTGTHMWSFARHGVMPDMVTMGKPMGNGFPIAALVTRRSLAASLVSREGVFFSTFGGSPAAVAAAHVVLDVLEDGRVLPRVVATGAALRAAIASAVLPRFCRTVVDVRGVGLATGIEVRGAGGGARGEKSESGAAACGRLRDGLRARGVLVGTCGRAGDVLKVRPPLAFDLAHVPVFVAALVGTLEEMEASLVAV